MLLFVSFVLFWQSLTLSFSGFFPCLVGCRSPVRNSKNPTLGTLLSVYETLGSGRLRIAQCRGLGWALEMKVLNVIEMRLGLRVLLGLPASSGPAGDSITFQQDCLQTVFRLFITSALQEKLHPRGML